jgi:putative alpha-1,2-mannosidase
VSFISTDQACSTADSDYNFEKVKSDTRAQWNDVLGRVKDKFGDAGERTTEKQKELVEHFYSSVSLSVNSRELAMNDTLRATCSYTGRK